MHISEIRKQFPFEEISYLGLQSILQSYAQPRNKIRQFLKSGDLIRIKKGLYVFGPRAALGPYCKEHLANIIYGPSAISLEYALSFYNMIPERVAEVTSITIRKNKSFITPVGRFSYRYLAPAKYTLGITQITIEGRNILIATPEKAIFDMLSLKTPKLNSIKELQSHLYENLRLETESILKLDHLLVKELFTHYCHSNIKLLLNYLGNNHE
jgi:predicted transcriptional regulator of viral defense system